MNFSRNTLLAWYCLGLLLIGATGCAEGIFWRSGHYAPWVRNQWAEEEKIADTNSVKKKRMNSMVLEAEGQQVEEQTKAAKELKKIIQSDPIQLTRIHAVRLLGRLNCPTSLDALRDASEDPDWEVRIAAIRSWTKLPAETAVPEIQEILGRDTHVDVCLAATKSLGQFPGMRTVGALSLALNDSDPALQLAAVESLEKVTGEKLGRDVPAWKQYVKQNLPTRIQ